MFYEFLQMIADSQIGTVVRENGLIFPWLEVLHVLGISAVIGSIAIVDLRLLGLASTTYPVSRLAKSMLPITWIGFGFAVVTGLLMFSSQPITYFDNFAFRMKMLTLLAAALNMAVFHLLTWRGLALWDRDAPVPGAAKIAGLLSILIWIAIVALGRWIGFTMDPF
ncbi:MAG: conserved hypothetical rane protein [Sphingomonas bacterium]|jgi:hypothetical protein|nr:conserved hypothetical rane protein [Sphingomonas bacterium]MDB5718434.1 conserved hypothetical rane protein [Sphingomonas bacterium]